MWNGTCGDEIPTFAVRPQGMAGGVNVTVNVVNGTPPQCQENQCACTDIATTNGVLTGGTVHVDSSCGKETVAHELGHLLGLADTFDSSCVSRIMYGANVPAGTSSVHSDDCMAAGGLWDTPGETDPVPDGEGEPEPTNDPSGEEGSPIIVDLDRDQFHLSGLDDPVSFDIDADGELETLSWTAAETLDAFLALDRNGNGAVDSGAELFGDHTLLIDGSTAANGYIPLAEFDLAAMGGNENGFIDPGDVIYQELRLWIDWNHDGLSEPEELLSLADAAVSRIELQFHASRRRDQHGNSFRYVSRAWIVVGGHERRTWTSDVFFVLAD